MGTRIVRVTESIEVYYAVEADTDEQALAKVPALYADGTAYDDLDCSPRIAFSECVVDDDAEVDGAYYADELEERGFSLLR